jgi:lycopene beta-cyclase
VIAGAGAAGLSLAWCITQQPSLRTATILLIDRSFAPANDKTWCFWDDSLVPDRSMIHKQWQHMQVSAGKSLFSGTLRKTTYSCLRSIDFSAQMHQLLDGHPQVSRIEAEIRDVRDEFSGGRVESSAGTFSGRYVFQSVRSREVRPSRFGLMQHFMGFEIETESPHFNADVMTIMDFRVPQHDGTGFMYVLPTAANRALVEYTLFSPRLLADNEYESALHAYITGQFALKSDQYTISRVEKGIIPMSEAVYEERPGRHIFSIGAASGLTKPSTGYAFTRILRQSRAIAEKLSRGETPSVAVRSSRRFRFYDLLLLDILRHEARSAEGIFAALFRRNPMDDVLTFLEERTDISTEIGIFTSLPWGPFIRALVRNLPYLLTARY